MHFRAAMPRVMTIPGKLHLTFLLNGYSIIHLGIKTASLEKETWYFFMLLFFFAFALLAVFHLSSQG
jgi:hypothetical protein